MARPLNFSEQEKELFEQILNGRITQAAAAQTLGKTTGGFSMRFKRYREDKAAKRQVEAVREAACPEELKPAAQPKPAGFQAIQAVQDKKMHAYYSILSGVEACVEALHGGELNEHAQKTVLQQMKAYAPLLNALGKASDEALAMAKIKQLALQSAQLARDNADD